MYRRDKTIRWILTLIVAALGSVPPIHAAGFGIFEHGAKAMGMAGAFTAQADDPSAMFHNAGGLAFQGDRDILLGVTWITQTDSDFTGAPPFPGPGVTEEIETLSEFPPHLYWVEPINARTVFGLGIFAPFGLKVDWANEDNFTGRAISEFSEMKAIDINPTIAWKASDTFGIGIGFIARVSDVELRNRTFVTNPFTGMPAEVAKSKLEGGTDEDFGWNIGFLHRYNNSFSWGLSYRSSLEIEYGGELRLTQILTGNPIFDGIIANTLPFGEVVGGKTAIEFPDMASLGLAFALSPSVLLEVDVNWTGWSSFDQLVVEIDNPALEPLVLNENWDDAYNYRLGVKLARGQKSEWRFGYVYDETPQPDETVSPVLPDSDRNGFTIGYGRQGNKTSLDLALMYLPFDDRTTLTSELGYNGTYEITAWLFGVSIGF
jgi:long-chain fatty acid transport protein